MDRERVWAKKGNMTLTKTKSELFKEEVRKSIQEAIARLDKGTVGISADCLWQCTRIISTDNSPKGTNAAYFARQVFNETVACKPWSNFVY